MQVNLSQFKDRRVCVLGLGYVGLTLAAAMADSGFEVTGVEIRPEVLDALRNGKAHFYEPGLTDILSRVIADGRLQLSQTIPEDTQSTVYIITVGTTLGPDGRAQMDSVQNISRNIAKHLKDDDMVILRSTVKVGTSQSVVRPILEETGKRFDLAFCPERTIEGKALIEIRKNPQIVAGHNLESTFRAAQFFQMLTPTVVRVSSLEAAEMIKLIDNAQRDVSFSYSNEVARMCDNIGLSAAEVISAGGLGYPRHNLKMPGPVGGPCLEKDSYILAESLEQYGYKPEITILARALNERQPYESMAALKEKVSLVENFPGKPRITLMGVAFKGQPITDDVRGSMAIPTIAALKEQFPGAELRGYDPVVSAPVIESLGLKPVASIDDAFEKSDINIFLNNHPDFSRIDIARMMEKMNAPAMVYDFWNLFSTNALSLPAFRGYMTLGSHALAMMPSEKPTPKMYEYNSNAIPEF